MLELLRAWFPNVLSVSVTTGVVLAVLLLAAPALAGRVKARWWCLAWVLLALRLVVPLHRRVLHPAAAGGSPPCPTGVTGGGNP